MKSSLKESIRVPLLAVILGNAVVFYIAVKTGNVFSEGLIALLRDWQDALPVGGAVLLTTLLNGLLNRDYKARVVFWRWHNPLPSREAFSRHAITEQRADLEALENSLGSLPSDAAGESTLWYKIYNDHRDDPAVRQAHRDYLLMRDWCGLSFLGLVVLGGAGLFIIEPRATAWVYSALLLAQYLLTMISARNYGVSLVRNVLALESGAALNET